ncbi:WAP four-disulfide core domain protein 8 [Nothobranchius furzeri]|uniref:WAP four-disulfide core domain protein 8 n=1 Tax=Nothobranchius furzeri TaxID=105023 RepID=UPI00390492E2
MRTHWSTLAALILGFCVVLSSNSIMPKPGNCPRDVPFIMPLPPRPPCNFDNDCPEDEKCCLFNRQRTCVSPVPTTPRCPIIPGVMPICGEMCSSDSDCPFGEKCCDNGCGHVCLSHELVKPGSCPIVLFALRCFDHCRGDSSCSNELKCCPTICGFKCVEPIQGSLGFTSWPSGSHQMDRPSVQGATRMFAQRQLEIGFCVVLSSNSIMPKPGNCPSDSIVTMQLSPRPPCKFDGDCPVDEKCCFLNDLFTCVSPVQKSPRCPVIPGVMYICAEHCTDDSDCPPGEKCCYDGCGHICLSQEMMKPGNCPTNLFAPRCVEHCRVDSSCPNELKCCPTPCGFSCVMPVF